MLTTAQIKQAAAEHTSTNSDYYAFTAGADFVQQHYQQELKGVGLEI